MEGLSIWNPREISAGQPVSWKLGRLVVWVERYEREWHILPEYGGNETDDEAAPEFLVRGKAEKPVSSDWKHYLLRDASLAAPVPAMVDRPVVLRPDRILVIPPGERAQFFAALPVVFRLTVGKSAGGHKRRLCEFPILPLANAWFGDPIAGELCYYTETRLYPEFGQIRPSPYQAVCPLKISNESDRELQFDRICLHTEFLGIYRGPSRHWTNEVSVVFKGPDHATQILPSKSSPSFEGASKLLTEPHQAIENWYFKRTFDLLKYFTGF